MPKRITVNDNFRFAEMWRQLKPYAPDVFLFVPVTCKMDYHRLAIGVPEHVNVSLTKQNSLTGLVNPEYVLPDSVLKQKLKQYPFVYVTKTDRSSLHLIFDFLTDNLTDDNWVIDNFRTNGVLVGLTEIDKTKWIKDTLTIYFKKQEDINLLKIVLSKSKT